MCSDFQIAAPERSDIPELCDLLVRSITELCVKDHANDAAHLAAWTENKTPAGLSAWFDNPDFQMLVRKQADKIVAVGGFGKGGHIDILYVDPEARSAGHSSALLTEIENQLAQQGVATARLTSTKTALAFYQKHGWQQEGDEVPCHSVTGLPLFKQL